MVLTMLAAAAVSASMVSDVEVSIDPPTEKGRIVVNASFSPNETVDYEKIVFTCTLRQLLRLPDGEGGIIEKVYEPVRFKYARTDERMVKGLRKHIHFPVPVGLEELRDKYGRLTFKFDQPVTVSHVRVEAYAGGEQVWTIERDVYASQSEEESSMMNMMR